MQNSDPKEWNFLSAPNSHVWFFFLHTVRFRMFYFKSSIHYHSQWHWCRTSLNLTSSWRRNDINLTIKLCDVLYNQCKPNSRANFFFCATHGWDNMGEIRISIPSENLGFPFPVCKNIRILHECEVRIENSVPRVTVWHHEALPSDAKQWTRGTEFSIHTEHWCWILFLAYFWFRIFYFKSSIHCRTQWRWRRTFLKLRSLWHRCDVNLTTKLHDVLYNQCKPDSHEKVLFRVS